MFCGRWGSYRQLCRGCVVSDLKTKIVFVKFAPLQGSLKATDDGYGSAGVGTLKYDTSSGSASSISLFSPAGSEQNSKRAEQPMACRVVVVNQMHCQLATQKAHRAPELVKTSPVVLYR